MPKHCFICPTFGHYDYARAAIASFFKHTSNGVVIVVDDAHPKFHKFWDLKWAVEFHRFDDRGGVTRSWNYGLRCAKAINSQYAICGNDDILFTPGWQAGPECVLEDNTVGIVGPLSNGPGLSNNSQNIWEHVKNYKVSDAPKSLAKVAACLAHSYAVEDSLPVAAVNGFFMIAKTERWWEAGFDRFHVFNPERKFSMVHSEHELQTRFLKRNWTNLVSLRTFIFHYRSVSRGDDFKHGLWYRRNNVRAKK